MASAKMISDSHQIYSLPFYANNQNSLFLPKATKDGSPLQCKVKTELLQNTTMHNHVLTLFNLLIYISIMHFTGLN